MMVEELAGADDDDVDNDDEIIQTYKRLITGWAVVVCCSNEYLVALKNRNRRYLEMNGRGRNSLVYILFL